ncbi:MAG TPA: polysaccharide biosynthesis C-terminal domain-containing protein [Flavitalea sp.]|nr:polysaccharide biosynthesis C-terminal domain-containing protein [Flavitalea sp.]HTF28202.1 polysaccharide biosynthesis C-terminal domain-containing protein [Flavitalea sp.]
MSGIKKLAGQTLWYGVPNIVARFLNFGMSLLGFRLYDPSASSYFTQVYAIIPFLTILYTYGLETSYFRFAQTHDRKKLYNTLNVSILISTIGFTLLLFLFRGSVIDFMEMEKHPEFVTWMLWIIFFDTLIAIPMAKLRLDERPQKYAFINFFGVILNILLVLFFYYVAKPAYEANHRSFLGSFFDPAVGIGYFILANVIASAVKMLMLWKEFAAFRFEFDKTLWREILKYSYPLLIVGTGGMINEMLSRAFYQKILHDDPARETFELGVFGANYRLAVLVTIFIQMFKLAAEPFFFNQSKNEGAQRTYARVMKFFVIACCFMFLSVSLFMEVWKYLIASKHPEYAQGLNIVPILAMGNIFLGIYYNLSVWYKLTNKNMIGAYVTIAGAVITIVLNFVLVPEFRYTGAAWATFICYTFMMVISYKQGQKYYKIPYPTKKLITYLVICTLLYVIHELIIRPLDHSAGYFPYVYYGTSLLFFGLFTLLILKVERNELVNLPVVGKYVERYL